MHTRCPHCRTVFRVQESQLVAAAGKVRCGACQTVFDARAQRLADPPAPTSGKGKPHGHGVRTPFDSPPAPAAAPRRTLSTSTWTLLNLALILLLVGQYAYHHRETFGAQPALRPAMERFCAVARCALPPWRDLAALELTSRNVQSHPVLDNALLIDATFVNRAAIAQPYPDLLVMFLNTEERPIASRRFTAAEYSPKAPLGPLAAGAEAHAVLEILDPGDRAFGYEIAFR